MTRRLSRRGFVGLAAGIGAATAVGVPLVSGARGSASTGVLLPSRLPLPRTFSTGLTLPPVLPPIRVEGSTVHYEISQRAATAQILPGVTTRIWGYDGQFPGPTMRVRPGQRVVVRHRNELPVPVVVHLHGAHTPHGDDGYPGDLILPPGWPQQMNGMAMPTDPSARVVTGGRDYVYPIDQRPATLWYHDHRMGFTGASVWRGLAGFFIIDDDLATLPSGPRDWPLMITDRSFEADGSFRYPSLDPDLHTTPGVRPAYAAGVLGDVILVNGRPWPRAAVDGARYRLRLLNASNARRYRLRLDPPGELVQIGSDGGLLAAPLVHDAIEIAPAERFDVVVDFARYRPGEQVVLRNDFGDDTNGVIMRFDVGERALDRSRIPEELSDVETLPRPRTERTMVFRDQGGTMGWQINGHAFDPAYANATITAGDVEVWRLVSDFHHPVHLHLVQFQVLSRGLKGPGEFDHGWKDVIDLRPAEEARIIARYDGEPGRYVFHCHNLEHEDMAMMGNFVLRA